MPQPDIRLIHWNAVEAERRAGVLRAAGFTVTAGPIDPAGLRALRVTPPAAVVIDLTRLPSHGREVALALRNAAGTRHVPLLFVDGDAAKVERMRALLLDAVYTDWTELRTQLVTVLANPPANPLKPVSVLAGYSGTPLPRKLGLKPESVVVLLNAPDGFVDRLGELPPGIEWKSKPTRDADLTLWFVESAKALTSQFGRVTGRLQAGLLWIAWPKQGSGRTSDVTQALVRQTGLAAGWVDSKICAIDATWSGLRFTRRKPAK